jgi:DNA-binding beta-propeller fold protein YncE
VKLPLSVLLSSVPSVRCASRSLALPAALSAQSFKVQQWNIGGEGGTDYLTAEPGTGRVFVSRGTHAMVVDDRTGKVLGDIRNAPRNHGIALAETAGHGFITASGDSSVIMFNLDTLAELRRTTIPQGGQDGIMYDAYSNRVILTNHSRPVGTGVALDANTGEIVGAVNLESTSPEGAASDGKGMSYVNNEGTSTVQAIDERTWTVTIARQNGADRYTVIATIPMVSRAKPIAVDPVSHTAYLFQPEYGPPPAGAAPPPAGRRGRGPMGPMVAAWFVAITH